MANLFMIAISLLGVLQTCAQVSAENEVEKLFSPDQRQRAKSVGLSDDDLMEFSSQDVTFDEMIQVTILQDNFEKEFQFNLMTKVCEILIAGHRTEKNFTNERKVIFEELREVAGITRESGDQFYFIRNAICPYLSQPSSHEMEARSFGLQMTPYMKFHFLKVQNRNASGVERVSVAKKLCCVYQGRGNFSNFMQKSTFSGLSGEELNRFGEHWNAFQAANTRKSFENVCDFLHSENPTDECGAAA